MTLHHTPHFSLVSSSHMKLRCEYNHLYLLFTITNTYFRYNSRSAVDWLQEVISPGISNSTMSAFSTNNSDSMTLIVPKLCDDGDEPGSPLCLYATHFCFSDIAYWAWLHHCNCHTMWLTMWPMQPSVMCLPLLTHSTTTGTWSFWS